MRRLLDFNARYFAAVTATLRISWVATILVRSSETKSSTRSSRAPTKRAVESIFITMRYNVIVKCYIIDHEFYRFQSSLCGGLEEIWVPSGRVASWEFPGINP